MISHVFAKVDRAADLLDPLRRAHWGGEGERRKLEVENLAPSSLFFTE
jgi:hypothetical protein